VFVVCLNVFFAFAEFFPQRGQGQPFYTTINPQPLFARNREAHRERAGVSTHTSKLRHANTIFIVGVLLPAVSAWLLLLN